MKIKNGFFLVIVFASLITAPFSIKASAKSSASEIVLAASEFFASALYATDEAGGLRFTGTQTTAALVTKNGRTNQTHRHYQVSGYRIGSETFIQFDTRKLNINTGQPTDATDSKRTSLLIRPNVIYGKQSGSEWVTQDVIRLLTQFTNMGVLDQFFILEILSGERLPLYQPHMSYGADALLLNEPHATVKVEMSAEQYAEMIEVWTQDIRSLLGPASDNMSDIELRLVQMIAHRTLTALDAEINYVFYINKKTNLITRIDGSLNTADPNGPRDPGAVARTLAKSSLRLYDFGKKIIRIVM
ncbi:MAG: hypothetical protein FWE82_04450 [Defluviitaleaceae bacterium]|nr:hypothetical protein [Defluviitaleaceae bacterium]